MNALTLNFVQKVLSFSVWAGGRQLSCSIGHMTVVGQTSKFQQQSPDVRNKFCVPLSSLHFRQFYNRGTVTNKPEIHFDLTFLLKIVRMPIFTITLFGFSIRLCELFGTDSNSNSSNSVCINSQFRIGSDSLSNKRNRMSSTHIIFLRVAGY